MYVKCYSYIYDIVSVVGRLLYEELVSAQVSGDTLGEEESKEEASTPGGNARGVLQDKYALPCGLSLAITFILFNILLKAKINK